DFTQNPLPIGTPAVPFGDSTVTGGAASNKAGPPAAPITAATTLSGAPGTDSIVTNFIAGDTITVNGTTITFVAAGAVGNQVNLQLRWAKTDSASLGGGHQDSWSLFYQTDPAATGVQPAWINAGTTFTFGPSGAMISPPGSAVSVPSVTVAGQSLGNVTINVG